MPPSNKFKRPSPFLTVRVSEVNWTPSLCGLCVGYESKAWRRDALASHIVEWLPEFALTPSEWTSLGSGDAVELLRKAAQTVYKTKKFKRRGEFGELFLHAAIGQVHGSLPAISKIYYKTAANDTVKGFDAVHVVGPPGNMELWLGEAKFYRSISRAIADVTKELEAHLGTDYLRSEFLLIEGKVDDHWPHTPQLRTLLSNKTSLDEVFQRACIPVLLTYESACVSAHSRCTAQYVAAFRQELITHYEAFKKALKGKNVPAEVRVHLFLMPLHLKADLINALDQKLKAWQQI